MIMHTIIDTGDSQTPDVINFSFNEKIGRGYIFLLQEKLITFGACENFVLYCNNADMYSNLNFSYNN